MSRSARHNLWRTPLATDQYGPDVAVLDRYVAFSAELVRLSLAGIAAYGFLLARAYTSNGAPTQFLQFLHTVNAQLTIGLGCLALAASCALAHRYFATDGLTHIVRLQRASALPPSADRAAASDSNTEQLVQRETRSLEVDVRLCGMLLIVASIAAAAGFMTTALIFFQAFRAPAA
jgi:hypothetical protein